MSKLTEIMKQIPLDELTGGDNEMKENSYRKIEQTTGGAVLKKRVGIIGTAAACAALAAGGIFAYSRLHDTPVDHTATDIVNSSLADTDTEQTDTDAYSKNAQIYREFYKSIGTDYSLVENSVRPFAQSTKEYDAEGGVKFRLVGTRSVGPFIMVDIGFENPDEVDLMQNTSQDITLTLPDGSVIVGDRIPSSTSAKAEIKLESFLFPQYVTDKDGNTHYIKDGDKLTFWIGTLAVDWGYFQAEANEDIKRHSYEINEEFTYQDADCLEYTLAPDTVISVPAFAPEKSSTGSDQIRIKEINYGPAGCEVVFTIEDADDEYKQAVVEKMRAEVYGDYRYDAEKQELIRPEEGYGNRYNEEFLDWSERYKEMVTAFSDTMSVRYMTHTATPTLLKFDKLNDDGDFMAAFNYLNDPLDVSLITKFILGKGAQAEITLTGTAELPEDSGSDPAPEIKNIDDLGITLQGVKIQIDGKDMSKLKALVYVDFNGLTGDPDDIDFDRAFTVKLPDGREISFEEGSTIGGTRDENGNSLMTYTGALPLTDLGIASGSELKLMMKDLYDMAGRQIAEGYYEKTFTVEYNEPEKPGEDESDNSADADISGDFTSSHGQSILNSAAISGWTDEDGEHEFDKSNATIFDEPAARTKSGFDGMDFELAALVRAEDRYYAPVVNITCAKRDEILLTKDIDTSLGVENEFVLRTADGREIKAMGQGYMFKGTSWLILTPTFDVSEYGLKRGDRVTLVLTKLIAGNGTVIAEGEFETSFEL